MIRFAVQSSRYYGQLFAPNLYDSTCGTSIRWFEREVSPRIPQPLLNAVYKIAFYVDVILSQIGRFILFVLTAEAGVTRLADVSSRDVRIASLPLVFDQLKSIFRMHYEFDYLKDLNDLQRRGNLPKMVQDERINGKMGSHLNSRRSVALIGKAGCGKTSTVYSFVQWQESSSCPEDLKKKRVYQLDLDALLSDPDQSLGILGQVVSSIQTDRDAILFIDEGHRLKDRVHGFRIADILKPIIQVRNLVLVVATTDQESQELFQDKALKRRFAKIAVNGNTDEKTTLKKIINGVWTWACPTQEALEHAYKKADDYFPGESFPDNAIRVLEYAGSLKKKETGRSWLQRMTITKSDIEAAENEGYYETT